MGKIRIVKGVISEVGKGIVSGDAQHCGFSFVKIGSERIMNLNCGLLITSFIKPGKTLRMSIISGWSGKRIAAIQLPDGEILKEENHTSLFIVMCNFVLFLIGFACIAFPAMNKYDLIVPFVFTIVSATISTYLVQRYRFRGRKALDNLSFPVLQ